MSITRVTEIIEIHYPKILGSYVIGMNHKIRTFSSATEFMVSISQ